MQQAKAWGFDLHVLFCILSTLHCFCFLLLLCLTCFFTSLFELSCSFSEPDQTRPDQSIQGIQAIIQAAIQSSFWQMQVKPSGNAAFSQFLARFQLQTPPSPPPPHYHCLTHIGVVVVVAVLFLPQQIVSRLTQFRFMCHSYDFSLYTLRAGTENMP